MKITAPKEIIQEKLSLASKFILTKFSASSSLQGGMLKFTKNKLQIFTTNLNDFFYTEIKIENVVEKTIVIDIRKVVEFLSFLSPGKIKLELKEKILFISSERTQGSFNLMSVSDFPELPVVDGKQYKIKKSFLEDNLPLVVFAASSDETRPILTGVNFASSDNQKHIVATDGFRLSLVTQTNSGDFPDIIISARLLHEILRLKTKSDVMTITTADKEKIIAFSVGEDTIYSRLIEGEFPPFEKVIPETCTTKLVINREELLKNIKLAAVFAREFSNIVIFDVKKDGLYLKPRTKEDSGSVVYQEAEVEGEEKRIAFNYKFVLDFLTAVKTEKIVFEMTQSNAPSVFKMAGKENFLHIIMPVRTEDESVS